MPKTTPSPRPRTPPPLKDPRGGPYARRFKPIEFADVTQSLEKSLENEIAALRVAASRMLELSECIDDPAKAIAAYNYFGAVCLKIGQMITQQHLLKGADDAQQAISQALTNAMQQMKIK